MPTLDFSDTPRRAPLKTGPRKLNFGAPSIASFAPPTGGGGGGFAITPPGDQGTKKKAPSLWNQVSDIVTGVPAGVVKMAGDALASTPGAAWAVRAGWRAAHDKPVFKGGVIHSLAEYEPAVANLVTSFRHTGGDVIHPTNFAKAVKSGTIVNKVLEDAANVSIVAGPAAKGLGIAAEAAEGVGAARTAATLRGVQTGVEYAHSVAGPIADAPISLPRRGLTFLTENARSAVATAAEGEGAFSGAAKSLRSKMPVTFSEQGRALNTGLKSGYGARMRAKARVARNLFTEGGLTDKDVTTRPSMAEQGAAVAMLSGVGAADEMLRIAHPLLTDEQVRLGHVARDIPEQTYTSDVADVVRQYQGGTLHPEARARVDRFMNAARSMIDAQTERGLAGDGRLKGPIDSEWLGHDPIDGYVVSALEEQGIPQTQLDDMNNRRAAGESWESIEQSHPVLTDVLDNPLVWPKPWRPAMRAMALGNEKLTTATAKAGGTAVHLPHRPPDLMAMGMEQPKYLSSSPSELAQPLRVRSAGEATNRGMAGLHGLTSEQMSVSNEYLPMSARTLAESVGAEAGRTEFNRHMLDAIDQAKISTVSDVLGAQETLDIMDQATREAKAQRFSPVQTKRLVGSRLNDALNDAGHSPIVGSLAEPQPGSFDMGAHVNFEDVNADTPAIHSEVKTNLTQRWANKGSGGVPVAVLDWINTKYKANVLPFSLRWQLGDAVGGAYMAWAGGGINPAKMIMAMRQLKKLDPEAMQQLFEHPDFADESLSRGERQVINMGPDAPTPRTPIGKLKQSSFRLNNTINEVNRHSYLLAKVDKLLAEHGLSVEQLGSNQQAWARPEVQQAVQAAVDDAMKVMGTFDEMSPIEQRYAKRIFPFWAWYRHITALAWRTAIDNPARMMWTLRLGSMGADPDSDLPSWLKGSIPLPFGQSLSTSSLNPFGDVIGGEPIYSPTGALRAMSPGIKLGAAALTGADLDKGLMQLTRPYGSGWKTETGGAAPTPLAARPLELLYRAAKVLPISRVAMDVAPQVTIHGGSLGTVGLGPVVRTGSGAPIHKFGTASRVTRALPLLGLPITPRPTTRKG